VLEEHLQLVQTGPPVNVTLGSGIDWVDIVNHVVIPETVVMLLQEDFPDKSQEDVVALFYRSRAFGLAAFGDLEDAVVQEQLNEIADGLTM
jgi:hypothetical protein